jgi:hypothetical protein
MPHASEASSSMLLDNIPVANELQLMENTALLTDLNAGQFDYEVPPFLPMPEANGFGASDLQADYPAIEYPFHYP